MFHRHRRTAAALLAVASMISLAACGSSSSSSSGSGASGRAAAHFGLQITASQRTCLKKHGVTLPSRGAFGKRPAGAKGGRPPSGFRHKGTPPKGFKRPTGAGRGHFGGATHTAAFKACGVKLSFGHGRGGPPTTAG